MATCTNLSLCYQNMLPGIFAYKTLESEIVECNTVFLQYVGAKKLDDIAGKTDFNFIWADYASYYRAHELDAISGKIYSAIHPGKNADGKEILFFNTKFPRYDEQGQLIGIIGHAIEIVNPNMLQLSCWLKKSDIDNSHHNYSIEKSIGKIKLTTRESECLFYLLRGKSIKFIGKLLGISPRTVEVHIEHLKHKFACRTKGELFCKATEEGFANNIPKEIFTKAMAAIL